jgi:pimeloyl-ACP methyl ester carboxylesterase
VQPLFEHRLELAGYETRALELEGEGPPLLLFHGYADSADTWRLTLDRLGRAGRRAVALDMPGFGRATPLTDDPILPQLDAFADAALEHFGEGEPALVGGNSLGGCVAMRLAERSELRGIVPVAPAGLDMARWFVLVERDLLVRTLLASPIPLPGPVVRTVVAQAYKRLVFRRPGSIEPLVAKTFAGHFGDRATARRIHATGQRILPELRDPFRLELIDCPVLLVWGRQDLLVFQTGAERVIDSVAETRLEVIEDCGHCPQLEAPERFCELLLDFPASLARAA